MKVVEVHEMSAGDIYNILKDSEENMYTAKLNSKTEEIYDILDRNNVCVMGGEDDNEYICDRVESIIDTEIDSAIGELKEYLNGEDLDTDKIKNNIEILINYIEKECI